MIGWRDTGWETTQGSLIHEGAIHPLVGTTDYFTPNELCWHKSSLGYNLILKLNQFSWARKVKLLHTQSYMNLCMKRNINENSWARKLFAWNIMCAKSEVISSIVKFHYLLVIRKKCFSTSWANSPIQNMHGYIYTHTGTNTYHTLITHTHIYIHVHMHTYMHAYIHIKSHIHTCTYKNTHTCACTYIHIDKHALIHT